MASPRPASFHPASLLFPLIAAGCASPLPGAGSTPTSTATFASATGVVAAAAMAYSNIAVDEGPPLSLTGTDGSGLVLTKLDARAVVEGPLAYTELHLYFHNPEARIREGRFAITLPPGAALSRFAMENDGQWMEAEVVEKMAARRAYEDFLHRRQDPALLEKAAGNEFSARVFPIPASGDKHLVVSYSQELPSSAASYVLPLRGLPDIQQVEARVRVARADRATLAWDETTLSQQTWKPDRDFVVPVTAPMTAIASGDWLATRVTVPASGAADDKPSSLAILVDTSASRALGFSRQIDQVSDLVAALAQRYGGDVEVAVAAFDQDVLPIYQGRADGWTDAQEKALLARQPLGASSLAPALAWAASSGMKRVVLVGDGVVTAGLEGDALVASIKALGAKGIERFDAVLSGGIRDVDAARTWVDAGLAHDGLVIDLGSGVGEAARRLGLAVRSDLAIKVSGASWSWPDHAAGVQPGDELVVYARGKGLAGKATIEVGGQAVEVAGVRTTGALLTRAAAQAEVARMERDLASTSDPKQQTALRAAIVKRSVESRVLSSLTAFLVLETEADYQRFGIARTALADILVVGKDGLELQHRAKPAVLIAEPPVTVRDGTKGKDKAPEMMKKELELDGHPGDVDLLVPLQQDQQEESLEAKPDANAEAGEPGGVMGGHGSGASAGSGQMTTSPSAPPPPPETTARDPQPEPRADRPAEAPRPARQISADDAGASDGEAMHGELARDSRRRVGGDDDGDEGGDDTETEEKNSPPALDGRLAKVMKLIADHKLDDALVDALSWRREQAGDVLALVALGEALEARGDAALAARAYGSLIDLFPGRADLRRFAGERLERVGGPGRALAIDTYQHAVDDRPDHLTGHRLLAMALVRAGRIADAFAALERGIDQPYPADRFRGGDRILREDLGMVAAAWIAKEPGKKAEITKRLATHGVAEATRSSLRFVLYWETDANDVDFHIRDARRGHAWYSHKQLRSGGELYEDVTTGYGPECFTINGEPKAGPYKLKIHYYSRGPMGYGMGVLEIMRHDGHGKLTFEHRPYIAMNDHAYVDLGSVSDGSARKVQLAK